MPDSSTPPGPGSKRIPFVSVSPVRGVPFVDKELRVEVEKKFEA